MNSTQTAEVAEPQKVNAETNANNDGSPSFRLEKARAKFSSLSLGMKKVFTDLKDKSPHVALDAEEKDLNILSQQLNNLEKNTFGDLQSESLKKDLKGSFSDTPRVIEGMIGKGEKWNKSLAQAVMNLHDGIHRRDESKEPMPDTKKPPKVILVTATSAIPYAIAIKECLRTAYPSEKPPKFFFVDVSKNRFGIDSENQRILRDEEIEQIDLLQIEKLKMVGEKYDAFGNTAVFDEYKYLGRTLKEVQKQLQKAGFANTNFMHGNWGYQHPEEVITQEIRPVIRKGEENAPYKPLALQVNAGSKSLAKDMKMIGRKMGDEILQHV